MRGGCQRRSRRLGEERRQAVGVVDVAVRVDRRMHALAVPAAHGVEAELVRGGMVGTGVDEHQAVAGLHRGDVDEGLEERHARREFLQQPRRPRTDGIPPAWCSLPRSTGDRFVSAVRTWRDQSYHPGHGTACRDQNRRIRSDRPGAVRRDAARRHGRRRDPGRPPGLRRPRPGAPALDGRDDARQALGDARPEIEGRRRRRARTRWRAPTR